LRTVVAAATAAAIVGASAGLWGPQPASTAFQDATFAFAPPTLGDGGSPLLTTSWHASDGISLDWDDESLDSNPAYFRGWGNSATSGYKGSMKPQSALWYSVCKAVTGELRHLPTNDYAGKYVWVHAQLANPASWYLWFSTSQNGAWNSFNLVSTVNSENPNCPWGGTHIHETRSMDTGSDWLGENFGRGFTAGNYYQNNSSQNWTRKAALIYSDALIPTQVIRWSDVDCSAGVDSTDALKVLRAVSALPYTVNLPCTPLFETRTTYWFPYTRILKWGDVDCSGAVDATDAQKILRFVSGLPDSPVTTPCPSISNSFVSLSMP